MWLYALTLDNRRLLGRYEVVLWHPAPTSRIRREYGLLWMVSSTIIKGKSMSEPTEAELKLISATTQMAKLQ